ncbi:1-aminocyclopropane-1-carboxylate synthase-like protein 1 [Chionoecetes opilio]|uniref:1-aminocyclopropane-1-carboxylate synthase-like protein 1 n=1 Tax=Chionoecetes opilio TaxID=41210 RepID=A0A8J4YL88_CHIOP|nr:1-aminocyclopropane-1-carboxylate synthase-like protein 1 [Chionoecetes opilio]
MAASTTPKSCFEKVLSPPPPFFISQRAQGTLAFPTFSSQLADQLFDNLYDRDSNPKGVVQLSNSINQLMEEEVLARVNQGHTLTLTPQHQYYSPGLLELRMAVANFLTRHHKPSQAISPDNLILMNGVTACCDALSHALCDPGDVVLTPTPVYARVYSNFRDRSGATVVPLPCPETDNFALQEGAMESLIKKHMEGGQRVRVCVLLHPHNPLGRIYSTQELQNILKLCAQSDPHHQPMGVVVLRNTLPLPTPVRPSHSTLLATLLNDVEWCDDFYIPTNKERLAASYKKARECLEACGAKVHRSVAGNFLWVNFQAFLDECTEQCEIDLFMAFLKGGVSILPGQKLYCAHPGWYRIVYSVRDDVLEEAAAAPFVAAAPFETDAHLAATLASDRRALHHFSAPSSDARLRPPRPSPLQRASTPRSPQLRHPS